MTRLFEFNLLTYCVSCCRWALTTLLIHLFVETGGMRPRARSLFWPSRATTLTWSITGLDLAGKLQGIIKAEPMASLKHVDLYHAPMLPLLTCRCLKVSSFGSLSLFRKENKVCGVIWTCDQIQLLVRKKLVVKKRSKIGCCKYFSKPTGAADRCLGCPIETDCPYSACKIYLDRVKQVEMSTV